MYRRECHSHLAQRFYTLRAAQARDTSKWTEYLNETLDMWGNDAEVLFMPHTWPVWGNKHINDYIGKYRDTIKYIHGFRPCTWRTRATP